MEAQISQRKKRVVVFGIFDGIHEGHRSLFTQAKAHGEELMVIVGRDKAAFQLKNKKPRYSERERLQLVLREHMADGAVLGDEEQSSYRVLEELNPDHICLGYDQQMLGEDLQMWMQRKAKKIPISFMEPYQPDVLHSSIL
ncbi:MAG: adenylyltransferase/cytidyltransferase family protein [Patescibacteria group bacterium]